MPLYDYKCKDCEHEWEGVASVSERYDTKCPTCGSGKCEILLTGNRQQIALFPEGFWEHIAPEPLYISGRRQLKDACKKHGCYAKYLTY